MSYVRDDRFLSRDDAYIIRTLDGSDTICNRSLGVTYHSTFGAVSESRHVFIQHGLSTLQHYPSISILEIGFGTGLNAFLAFLFSQKFHHSISYTGIESVPIDHHLAVELNYPSYLGAETKKDVFLKMHSEHNFSLSDFIFLKIDQPDDLESDKAFECIFFDAFAPAIQPELWEQNIFVHLYSITAIGGCLVTYCAQGEVRRRIERAGYDVRRISGAPGKRHMLQAYKRP